MFVIARPVYIAKAVLAAVAAAGIACPAFGEIYKCVDRAGRITYQQQPCPETQTGGRVVITVDNGSTQAGDDSNLDWAAKAKRKEVGPGMPRAFVIQAFGTPRGMRPARARENASEVWEYRRADLEANVGFKGGVVAWVNDNSSEAAPTSDSAATPRQTLSHAVPCGSLAGELGAPSSALEEFDEALSRKVIRHRWDPTQADREHLAVTCVDGKIIRIERSPA